MRNKNPGINLNDIPLDIFLEYYGKLDEDSKERYVPYITTPTNIGNTLGENHLGVYIRKISLGSNNYYTLDPVYEDTYLNENTVLSLMNLGLTKNILQHRLTIRNAYQSMLNALIDKNEDVFLVKNSYYTSDEIPDYSFYVKYTETTTTKLYVTDAIADNIPITETYNFMLSTDGTNGVPNDIVDVSAFIGLSMSDDAAVSISTESKTLFKEVFSLKDLSDNETDDIYYKNPTHKYLTNVTAGTLLIPKTKIVTANNGSSKIRVNSNIGDLDMMVDESNMTITLSLTKDKLKEISEIAGQKVSVTDDDDTTILIIHKNENKTIKIYGVVNEDSTGYTSFIIPCDLIYDEKEYIGENIPIYLNNRKTDIEAFMESLGTSMSLPVEIQKTDLEATAIQIYDSTSADIKTKYIVTFKSISYSKSSPITAYVAKQSNILTNNNSSIPIKKLVDTIGLSYIAFKEGYPGNKILSTYEKDSIAALKENLKNIISRRKVLALDAKDSYYLARSMSTAILNEMSVSGNRYDPVSEMIPEKDVSVLKIVISKKEKPTNSNEELDKLTISDQNNNFPKILSDDRDLINKLLTAEEFPLSKYYTAYETSINNLATMANGEINRDYDNYQVSVSEENKEHDSFEITPIYYKDAPMLSSAQLVIYSKELFDSDKSKNDFSILASTPIGLIGALMAAVKNPSSETIKIYQRCTHPNLLASKFRKPSLKISKKLVLRADEDKEYFYEYIKKTLYPDEGGDAT